MTYRKVVGPISLAIVLFTACALAQEPGGSSQAGATGDSGQAATSGQENASSAETADSRTFLGTENFSPGHVGSMRSYFLPSLSIFEMTDSNYQVGSSSHQYASTASVVGRLTFGRIGRHSSISGDYFGGESFYTHRSTPNSTLHQFGITASYTGRRWGLTLDDRATYLPESGYGFGGFGFTGGAGSGLGGAFSSNLGEVSSIFSPTGSLLTSRGRRVLNTTVAQVQYALSGRSSVSVGGSFGILHFRDPGFFDTKTASIVAAFSHSLNARDYMGVNYGLSLFKSQSNVPAFRTHFVQFSYGHKISGRMAMQFGGGPLIQVFTLPLAGSANQLSWIGTASLQARARRTTVSLSYSHYTTGGGGVLRGAITDGVRAQWTVPLSRKWECSFEPGFSHNRSLPQTTGGGAKYTFNSFYGRASLSRSFGRYTSMFIYYNYQAQKTSTIPCLTSNCDSSLGRNQAGLGLNFHPRQITFE